MPSGLEWLIILGVVVLLFGAKKLPEFARSLGRSSSEFKRGVREGQEEPKGKPETGAEPGQGDGPRP